MMKNYETDETFLGRWIAGELSEEERIAFEKTEAYKEFSIINKESQLLEGPDIDTETALKIVKERLNTKKPKVIKLWQSIAIASIIIISAGVFLNSSKTYTTEIGKTQTIILPDGSAVDLNANSSLSHKRFFWNNSREVSLNGEGYFTVTKGDDFKVNTSKGIVSVLGTRFNIKDRSIFNLKCYEGKVSFKSNDVTADDIILSKGMEISLTDIEVNKNIFIEENPNWKNGSSYFTGQPLRMVLEELMNYYPITFETSLINTDRLFTGSFIHTDLNTALKTTLVPMGITYKKDKTGKKIMLSK